MNLLRISITRFLPILTAKVFHIPFVPECINYCSKTALTIAELLVLPEYEKTL